MDLKKNLSVAEILKIRMREISPVLLLLAAIALSAKAQPVPRLFVDAPSGEAHAARIGSVPGDPVEVLRSRPAAFSLGAWRTAVGNAGKPQSALRGAEANATLTLNLFADTSLDLYVESLARTSDRIGQTVRGRIGEPGEGTAIFTLYDGALSGSVRLAGGEFYEIFVPRSGAGDIRQVAFHGFRAPGTDAVLPKGEATAERGDLGDPGRGWRVPAGGNALATRAAGTGDPVVDVLVVYSERARQARGDAAGMLAHINQVIAEANAALEKSGVHMQYRLAHAAEMSWDDSASTMSYSSALSALRDASDGNLDQVHALRNQYAADMVSLWVSPPLPGSGSFTTGMAYILANNPQGFEGYAFSVVNQAYAGGASATFAHETGHNLGLNHDPDNGGASGGLAKDSVGYQQKLLDPKFFTIMAYSTGCGGCQPLVQFSNPLVNFQGIPTGVAGTIDSAKTLNLVAPYAAGWRGAPVTPPACSYTVSPSSIGMPAAGGGYVLNVNTAAGCVWTPVSNASWITVNGSAPRSGPGDFSVNVLSNTATSSRNSSLEVAGKTVGVAQDGVAVQPVVPARISAKALSFQSEPGGSPPPQTLQLRSVSAVASLAASASNAPWLSASTSLQGGAWRIAVRANAQGLAAGVYDADLLLDCGAAVCNPGSVPVRLVVRNSSEAAPRIASGGVVNAASFQPGIASGAWMSIFGSNLSSSTRTWRPADFQGNLMPRSLDGVQVLVGGQSAAVQFIGPGQVNFQAPSNLAAGWVPVELRSAAGTDTAYVYSSRESPGFFMFSSEGHVAALHPDGTPVGDAAGAASYGARPAGVGEVLAIYGTGFGPTTPEVPAGEVFTGVATLVSRPNLSVTIGGQAAEIRFAGLTGAGLNQINVAMPALAPGTYEIVADVAGSPTQFSGKVAVR